MLYISISLSQKDKRLKEQTKKNYITYIYIERHRKKYICSSYSVAFPFTIKRKKSNKMKCMYLFVLSQYIHFSFMRQQQEHFPIYISMYIFFYFKSTINKI